MVELQAMPHQKEKRTIRTSQIKTENNKKNETHLLKRREKGEN